MDNPMAEQQDVSAVNPISRPLHGSISVPGDKSIAHRALMLAAAAEGTSHIANIPQAADVQSTIRVLRQLGADIKLSADAEGALSASVTGWGSAGPFPLSSHEILDCGNAGTTARMLMGLLAPWPIRVTITGDDSLRARPMARVVEPLEAFGVKYQLDNGKLPARKVNGSFCPIRAASFATDTPSAQVKSAILLAALSAQGTSQLVFTTASRDHTERMLRSFGITFEMADDGCIEVTGPQTPHSCVLTIPGDPSSAAPLICAAVLHPGSDVTIENLCLNETRIAYLNVLKSMGADISVELCNVADDGDHIVEGLNEPVGSVRVQSSEKPLKPVGIDPSMIPLLVDEVPILAVVAAHIQGESVFHGVGELHRKESDRLQGIADGLACFGIQIDIIGDDLVIHGDNAAFSAVGDEVILDAHGDHRMAMAWSVLGSCSETPISVRGMGCIQVSYPSFVGDLEGLTM